MAVAARRREERLKRCLIMLVCDFRWVRALAAAYDRWSFLDDCTGALEGAVDVLTAGERCAVEMISKVVLSIRECVFGVDDRCPVRGAFDTGCAGELHGRVSALKFGRLNGQGRRDALAVVASMKESIHTYARRPWLCPRNECYRLVDEVEEGGCEIAFSAGGRFINGVAIVDINGRRVLVSGCQDGAVRVHDLDDGGRMVREWREHENLVNALAVASGGWEGDGEASGRAVAASCSFDGTVRLWDIGGGAGSGGCVADLHSDKCKYLSSVSITPDARRVVVRELGEVLEVERRMFSSGRENARRWRRRRQRGRRRSRRGGVRASSSRATLKN
jgi:WD domain, G-beta repeat